MDAPWHLRSVSIHCVTQCTDYCSHLVYTTWYIALMIAPPQKLTNNMLSQQLSQGCLRRVASCSDNHRGCRGLWGAVPCPFGCPAARCR